MLGCLYFTTTLPGRKDVLLHGTSLLRWTLACDKRGSGTISIPFQKKERKTMLQSA